MGSVPNESCVLLVFRFTNVLSRLDYQVVCFLVNVFDFTVKYSTNSTPGSVFQLMAAPATTQRQEYRYMDIRYSSTRAVAFGPRACEI